MRVIKVKIPSSEYESLKSDSTIRNKMAMIIYKFFDATSGETDAETYSAIAFGCMLSLFSLTKEPNKIIRFPVIRKEDKQEDTNKEPEEDKD
jgi:hypothetical protein